MVKKVIYICLFMLLLFSCSKAESVGMRVNIEDGVTIYNGCEKREFNISPGKEGELKVSLFKESGKLGLKIVLLDDETYIPYDGSDCPEYFVVRLEKSGKYEVLISAENYKGTFKMEFSER